MDVLLETVNYCNLRCPACPWHTTMTREKRTLLPNEYEKIIEHIAPYTRSICFYVMGEPLLNEHIFDYVKIAHDKGIHTGFSTNAMLLREHIDDVFSSKLDFIQIALDGLDSETHEKYRMGSDYSKVVSGLYALVSKKKEKGSNIPEIQIQTLINKNNEYQLDNFKAFAESLGIGFSAKRMMFGKTPEIANKNRILFEPEQMSYRRFNNINLIYYRDMEACPQLGNLTILCNGDVVPCCYDYDGQEILGNLISQTWSEIEEGNLRRSFLLKREAGEAELCQKCDLLVEKCISDL